MNSAKALILLTSRPESMEIMVEKLRPEVVGVINSQEILEAAARECSGQEVKRVTL